VLDDLLKNRKDVDPFASEPPPPLAPPPPSIPAPRRLSNWISGRAIDLKTLLKEDSGVVLLGKDDTVVCDPSGNWVLACTKKPEVIDRLEPLFPDECRLAPKTIRTEIRLEESGGGQKNPRELLRCFLAARSGQKAHLSHRDPGKKKPDFSWSPEPTLGDADRVIDLRSELLVSPIPGTGLPFWKQTSSVSLIDDREIRTSVARFPGGREIKQRTRAATAAPGRKARKP
jgi:hypothetical protein